MFSILLRSTFFTVIAITAFSLVSCSSDDNNSLEGEDDVDTVTDTVLDVDMSLFLTDGGFVTVTTEPCTLSDGTTTDCYKIVSNNIPTDHEMGPWCPSHITDGPEAGGLWIFEGEVYNVDGPFIEGLSGLYADDNWQMYDVDGNIYKIETAEDCMIAADPQADDQFENFCLQCLPDWITDREETFLIPITPVMQEEIIAFGENAPPGQPVTSPVTRGVAFNGVKYDGPAEIDVILANYNIAPIDSAGGHINNAVGYHYHGDTGVSTKIIQEDSHAAMIGYALDGHGIYAELDANGDESTDLDECRGHYDSTRGYHYHAAPLGDNNHITCLKGAWVN